MPSLDDWKTIAEATLKGRSLDSLDRHHEDGVLIKPLYTEADRPDAVHPSRDQGGWQIAAVIEPADDAAMLNRMILDELEGGAGMIVLDRDQDPALLPDALDGVLLEAVRFVFTGNTWAEAGKAVMAAGQKAGIDPATMAHVLGGDPVADAEAAAAWIKDEGAACPGVKPLTVAGNRAHEDGHSDAGELAIMLAGLAHLLRVCDASGVAAAASLPRVHLQFALGADLYGGIAKTRAAQQVLARFAEACGVDPRPLLNDLHGITSARHLSRLDADTNILRNGTGLLAMVLGGVGIATSLPHDYLTGSSLEARRLARNSHHIMAAEARLDQVVDPAAGSFFIDSMTCDLAQAAWQRFQAIEAEGGIIAASGRLADEAGEAVQMRQQAVNQGRESLLGVTRHPQREAGLAPVLISSGAVPRGGAHRPAAQWEDLVESHRGRHHRILCLDIGTTTEAAAAASWIQLAGVEATVTQAETVDAALEMIAAARPTIWFSGLMPRTRSGSPQRLNRGSISPPPTALTVTRWRLSQSFWGVPHDPYS